MDRKRLKHDEQVIALDELLPLLASVNEVFEGLYQVWKLSDRHSNRLVGLCLSLIDELRTLGTKEQNAITQNAIQHYHTQQQKHKLEEEKEKNDAEYLLDTL